MTATRLFQQPVGALLFEMESSCAGEDPRIHPFLAKEMGCRVKPGNDGGSA
jgi:hypothetical protein